MAAAAGRDLPDQPLRPLWTATGLPPFQRTGIRRPEVPHAGSLPIDASSDLLQLVVYLLGNTTDDDRPPGVCRGNHRLHFDGDTTRGAGLDPGVRRCVSAI